LNGPWRYCLRPDEVHMTLQRVLGAALIAAGLLIQAPSQVAFAQAATVSDARFETSAMGFVRGQALRVTVSSVAVNETVKMSASLIDAQGRVLAQSPTVSIAPNTFRAIDFTRDSLGLAGEPGTGRLQVRLSLRIEVDTAREAAAMWKLSGGLVPNVELINAFSGQTESGMIGDIRTVISGEAHFQSANQDFF
jgi:hypothetical protein